MISSPGRFRSLASVLSLVVCLHAHNAAAQLQPPLPSTDGRVHYDRAFFAQFAPRTALDMLNHTPGFTLTSGDDSDARRGFEGAAANVLIDGERPVARRQTIADVLQRIPAARVAHIEIRRGADVAGDASGSAVIANIVLLPSKRYGVWSAGFELAGQHGGS